MVAEPLLGKVLAELAEHVRRSKGYETESHINPLAPMDSVAAFQMARKLTGSRAFDVCVAVAPEGHVYGYFFEVCLGAPVLSVHVGYPPRACRPLDDLTSVRDQRVLILEDDVASGTTLRLVTAALAPHLPRTIDLYLGRLKEQQILEHIPDEIDQVYLAEDHLDAAERAAHEADFVGFFTQRYAGRTG